MALSTVLSMVLSVVLSMALSMVLNMVFVRKLRDDKLLLFVLPAIAVPGVWLTRCFDPAEVHGGHGAQLAAALMPLGPSLPVARSKFLAADIQAICAAAALEAGGSSSNSSSSSSRGVPDSAGSDEGAAPGGSDADAAARGRRGNKHSKVDRTRVSSSGSSAAGEGQAVASSSGRPPVVEPHADAVDYSRYLQQLVRSWRSADSTEEQARLVGRVVAHVFAVHVSYASLATRVGAAAAEKLGLFQLGAVSAYRDYPDGVTDHLAGLLAALEEAEREMQRARVQGAVGDAAIGELARALEECALLVKALAAV